MPTISAGGPVLRGERVELRPPAPQDEAEVVAICRDPEIPRWTRVPQDYTAEHYAEFLRITREGGAAGTDHPFLVHAVDDDRVLGAVGLHAIDERDQIAEIGYWASADERGHGFITEAVGVLLEWAWRTTSWERIEIQMAVGNAASIRVAEKVGARLDGTLPNRLRLPDGRTAVHVYGLDRNDQVRA